MFDHEKQNLLEAVGVKPEELTSVIRTAVKAVEGGLNAASGTDGRFDVLGVLAASRAATVVMMRHRTVEIAVLAACLLDDLSTLYRCGALASHALDFLVQVSTSLEMWGVPFRGKRVSEVVEALCGAVPKPVLIDATLALLVLFLTAEGPAGALQRDNERRC